MIQDTTVNTDSEIIALNLGEGPIVDVRTINRETALGILKDAFNSRTEIKVAFSGITIITVYDRNLFEQARDCRHQ